MKTLRKMLAYALMGLGMGNLAAYLASLVVGRGFSPAVPAFMEQFQSDISAVGVQFAIFAGLGMVQGMAGSVFHQAEKHSLLWLTCLHYSCIVLPLLAAGWYLRWFRLSVPSLLGMLGLISFIYVAIYAFNYVMIKRDISAINTKLQ